MTAAARRMRWRSWWMAARMATWVAALRVGIRLVPVARLARLVEPSATARVAHERDVDRIVSLARRATEALSARPDTMCLVRSLVVYRYLLRAGESPELYVGFARTGSGLRGHAWVALGGAPVTDHASDLAALTISMAFVPGGVRSA